MKNEELMDLDLDQIMYDAEFIHGACLNELFSDVAKTLVGLLSFNLPEFIPGPLAHS